MIGLAGCAKKDEPKDDQKTPGAATQATQSTLLDTKWLLTELSGAPITQDTAGEPIFIQLTADSNRVAGFTGCNRLIGSYQADGDTLIFAHVATTKMACPSGQEIETLLLETLVKSWTFAIVGDRLDLKSKESVIARFKASKE